MELDEKKKVLLVAFNGESVCFAHVLLNALDMQSRGFEVKVVIEGAACGLVTELADPDAPFAGLYAQVRDAGLFDCVCRACAAKMRSLGDVQEQKLRLRGEMTGHPALGQYLEEGYKIITF